MDTKHRDRVKWLLSKWEVAPPIISKEERDGGCGDEGGAQEDSLGEVGSGMELIVVRRKAGEQVAMDGGQRGAQDGVMRETGLQETVVGEERGDQCTLAVEGNLARMAMEGDLEGDLEGRGGKGDERKMKRYRRVLNWGKVKYQEHRYKYDPCE